MDQPLAYMLRPETIKDVIGQKHILSEGKILNRMIRTNKLSSMILYGPPGTGKTTIAHAISKTVDLPIVLLNAVESGKSDVKKAIDKAKEKGKTILFIDEIHRFNKAQQDLLLPYLEEAKDVVLIGATTENPYHNVNPAIRSRCHVFQLQPLSPEDIKEGIHRALTHKEKGFGLKNIKMEDNAIEHLANSCGGDLRSALNGLELAVLSTPPNDKDEIIIDLSVVEECIQKKNFNYDRGGDYHYNLLSALQKSIRGSDANAALLYLSQLIKAGDLESICRRLLVIADEDIGLANSDMRVKTLATVQIVERVGLPECVYSLAACVIELCLSPKSNSATTAIFSAMADIEHYDVGEIPPYLKDSHYKSASKLGHGVGYLFPHDYELGWVNQEYLPEKFRGREYYIPKNNGPKEQALSKYYYWIKNQKKKNR